MTAGRFPVAVLLGAAALALAAAASLAALLPAELPAGIGTVGYPVFYRTAAHTQVRTYLVVGALFPLLLAGALLGWERLPERLRRAAAPASLALVAVLFALPPLADGASLAPALGSVLVVFALATLLGRTLTGPRRTCAALAAIPGAAVGLYAVAGGARPAGTVVALAALGTAAAVAALYKRVSAPVLLAAATPLCLLALDVACRTRFVDGHEVAGGYELPQHRALLGALAAAGMAIAALVAARRPGAITTRGSRRLLLWAGVPLLACAFRFEYRVHATDIDGLHEGEPLAAAAAIEAGARPYRDVVFFHGLGEDPGRALLAFRLFGRSVRALRILDDVTQAVDLGVFVLVGVAILPARWAILLAGFLVARALPAPTGSRSLFADAALVVLVLSLAGRRGRPRVAALGGAAVAFAALWGLDTGSAALVAAAAVLGLRAAVQAETRRTALAFAAGAGAVLGLFGVWLAVGGLLPSFLGVAREVASSFGLAYARPWEFQVTDHEGLLGTVVAPLVLVAGAAFLVLLALRRDASPRTWILLLVWIDAFLLFERGLDRHDPAHVHAAARMAWPLAFALLSRLRAAEAPIASLLAAFLLVPAGPVPGLPRAIDDFASKQDVAIAGKSLMNAPRTGVLVSVDQARKLSSLLAVIGRTTAGARFFDFTNHGALYFLADRPLPTRYTLVWLAASLSAQREVVDALRRRPPPVVLFRSGTSYDALDHIDNRVRHPLVAEHLVAAYRPFATVGGFLLLAEAGKAPPSAWPEVYDVVALRSVPAVWGAGGFDGMRPRPLAIADTDDGGVRLAVPDAARGGTAALALRLASGGADAAKLTWRVAGAKADEAAGVTFDLLPGAEPRDYLVPLSELPAWVWPEQVEAIELRLGGSASLHAADVSAAALEGTLDSLAGRSVR